MGGGGVGVGCVRLGDGKEGIECVRGSVRGRAKGVLGCVGVQQSSRSLISSGDRNQSQQRIDGTTITALFCSMFCSTESGQTTDSIR